MTLIRAPKVTKIICTGFSRPYYRLLSVLLSTTAAKPAIRCRCGGRFPHAPSLQPLYGIFPPSPFSTTAAKPAILCRCGGRFPHAPSLLPLYGIFPPSPFPQRQQNPRFCAVAEAAFPMYPLHRPLCGIFPPPPLSTTAVKSAFRCRCGSHRQSVSLL